MPAGLMSTLTRVASDEKGDCVREGVWLGLAVPVAVWLGLCVPVPVLVGVAPKDREGVWVGVPVRLAVPVALGVTLGVGCKLIDHQLGDIYDASESLKGGRECKARDQYNVRGLLCPQPAWNAPRRAC